MSKRGTRTSSSGGLSPSRKPGGRRARAIRDPRACNECSNGIVIIVVEAFRGPISPMLPLSVQSRTPYSTRALFSHPSRLQALVKRSPRFPVPHQLIVFGRRGHPSSFEFSYLLGCMLSDRRPSSHHIEEVRARVDRLRLDEIRPGGNFTRHKTGAQIPKLLQPLLAPMGPVHHGDHTP